MADTLQVNSPIRPTAGQRMTRDSSSPTRQAPIFQEDPQNTNQQEANSFNRAFNFLDKNKNMLNMFFAIPAAVVNLFAFLNGDFKITSMKNEWIASLGNGLARLGTAARGLFGAIDCYKKRNLLPLIGSLAELPIATLTGGELLWLARGFSQGPRQIQAYTKRFGIKAKLKDGQEIELGKKDGDNFAKYGVGFIEGATATLKAMFSSYKEMFTKPFEKEGFQPRLVLGCSTIQFLGPLIALTGLHKLGALFRDTGGAAVDIAYIIDKKEKDEPSYVPAGSLWLVTAISDYAKLFKPISSRFKHLTQLSLGCDPLAGILESWANFGKSNDSEEVRIDMAA